jgi:hypothetical protein
MTFSLILAVLMSDKYTLKVSLACLHLVEYDNCTIVRLIKPVLKLLHRIFKYLVLKQYHDLEYSPRRALYLVEIKRLNFVILFLWLST